MKQVYEVAQCARVLQMLAAQHTMIGTRCRLELVQVNWNLSLGNGPDET
jgi:hypothetical protein